MKNFRGSRRRRFAGRAVGGDDFVRRQQCGSGGADNSIPKSSSCFGDNRWLLGNCIMAVGVMPGGSSPISSQPGSCAQKAQRGRACRQECKGAQVHVSRRSSGARFPGSQVCTCRDSRIRRRGRVTISPDFTPATPFLLPRTLSKIGRIKHVGPSVA